MSEFTNRKAGRAETIEPTVSPVPLADALEFASLPGPTDPLMDALLIAATDAVINYIGFDLLTREWTLTHWDWPTYGTVSARNLGRVTGAFEREVTLPYARNAVVSSVTSYGEPLTEFINRGRSIVLVGSGRDGFNDEPAIVVVYSAGFGDDDADVPAQIKQAVLMLASWLYEHRGQCDAADGVVKSGAASMLIPWRKPELLW